MDYDFEFDTAFDLNDVAGDVDMDFDDDTLTLPEDDLFDDEDY